MLKLGVKFCVKRAENHSPPLFILQGTFNFCPLNFDLKPILIHILAPYTRPSSVVPIYHILYTRSSPLILILAPYTIPPSVHFPSNTSSDSRPNP